MKVIVVAPWGERLGGAERMLADLLRHAPESGMSMTVAFLSDGPFVEEARSLGVEALVVDAGRLREPRKWSRAILRLAGAIERAGPDVVLNWMPKTHLYGGPAAMRAGLRGRVVWWQHGIPSTNWLDRTATLIPARAVGCSSRASATAQARLWPRRQTFVVHPGIEPPASQDKHSARVALGISPDAPVAGIVGRLQPWKGQHRFIQALARLRASGRLVHGLVVGGDAYGLSPEYTIELERLVRDLNLSEVITFTGQLDDPSVAIAAMDVLVNASDEEPFGITLLEGMAAGVPVVAPAAAGPSEIVTPDITGVLVPSSAPDDLARGLARLLDDADLAAQIAEAGRTEVMERFTAATMAGQIADRLAAAVAP